MRAVLHCAGCGAEVSEWAARCPACHRSTDDAIVVTAEHAPARPPAAPTAPAAPPGAPRGGTEPPPGVPTGAGEGPRHTRPDHGRRPRQKRLTRRAVLLTTAATVAALIGTLAGINLASAGNPSSHRGSPALPRPALPGRILVQDPQGALVLVDPGTNRVVGSAGAGSLSGEVVLAAPDRRFVTTLQGDLLAVNNVDGLDQTDVPRVTRAALLGGPDTFAAGDRAVIVVASSSEQLRSGAISAFILDSRRSVALGVADEAAGDPQAVGAFVSVAVPGGSSEVPAGGYLGLPDSRVELRDAGHPAGVLATAAQLNAAMGQPADRPVHLSVFPNGAGTAVAVVLNPPLGGARNVGVVVLDRGGHVIAILPPPIGPVEYTWPSWSPDGQSLAYPTIAPDGTALAIWQEGGQILIRTAPDNGASFGYCLWAPDGSAILCPTSQSARANWDEGAARGGDLLAVPAPGNPISWLPAGTGPPREVPGTRHRLGMRRVLSF